MMKSSESSRHLATQQRNLIFVGSGVILVAMAKYTETVMVRDGGLERAVKVTIDAPTARRGSTLKPWRSALGTPSAKNA